MIKLSVVGSNRPALVDDQHSDLITYRWRFDKDGYVMRKAGGQRIYLHHVVMPGDHWPDYHRDHINRDKLDNRAVNLRWLTPAESQQNKSAYRCNSCGIRGVRFDPSKGQYLARVQHNGRAVARRWFNDVAEANDFLVKERGRLLPLSHEAA